MKIEKFQLRGNSSVYAGAFQLLRDGASAQLGGNIDCGPNIHRTGMHCVLQAERPSSKCFDGLGE
jgi:hypothetical protein